MTPGARVAAAALILDRIAAGETAERALTGWGRDNRFAGSGDRHALRDLVFSALRRWRSCAALGGGADGRGLMLGLARAEGWDIAALFSGEGHALPPPGPDEQGRIPAGLEALDCPDWLAPALQASLGPGFPAVMERMRHRAPTYLRVNARRASRAEVMADLAAEGIVTEPHPDVSFALQVTDGARKIQTSRAYADGRVELQDLSSQAVVEALPLRAGQRVLDLCAGGGGKTLALAARASVRIWAHDAVPRRMADLVARSARAGVSVTISERPEGSAPYDLILTDVPCSGSGSWRRDPEGKWALTADRLAELQSVQAGILDRAAAMLAPSGTLAYATCSLLGCENEEQVQAFLARHAGWQLSSHRRFSPESGGDGFFLAMLTRADP